MWAKQMVKSGASAAALSWVTGLASRLEHLLTARPLPETPCNCTGMPPLQVRKLRPGRKKWQSQN